MKDNLNPIKAFQSMDLAHKVPTSGNVLKHGKNSLQCLQETLLHFKMT